MARFRIYYRDPLQTWQGSTFDEWVAAPDDGVQVVAVLEPPPTPLPDRFKTGYVHCGLKDVALYTGVDEYDPLGFGVPKRGRLIPDDEYAAIWARAYGDSRPKSE